MNKKLRALIATAACAIAFGGIPATAMADPATDDRFIISMGNAPGGGIGSRQGREDVIGAAHEVCRLAGTYNNVALKHIVDYNIGGEAPSANYFVDQSVAHYCPGADQDGRLVLPGEDVRPLSFRFHDLYRPYINDYCQLTKDCPEGRSMPQAGPPEAYDPPSPGKKNYDEAPRRIPGTFDLFVTPDLVTKSGPQWQCASNVPAHDYWTGKLPASCQWRLDAGGFLWVR